MKLTYNRESSKEKWTIMQYLRDFDLMTAFAYALRESPTELSVENLLDIMGQLEGKTFFIPLQDVFYFESVDNSVFIYTQKQVFKSTAKLYILEEQLAETPFARISKNTILNLRKLQSVRPVKNARLEGTLLNGEKTVISRQYVQGIKKHLGV